MYLFSPSTHIHPTIFLPSQRGFSSGELYLVHVKDLTLSQLHNLKLDHSSILEGRRESFDASNAEEASGELIASHVTVDDVYPLSPW